VQKLVQNLDVGPAPVQKRVQKRVCRQSVQKTGCVQIFLKFFKKLKKKKFKKLHLKSFCFCGIIVLLNGRAPAHSAF
jgi:hypothetical protein